MDDRKKLVSAAAHLRAQADAAAAAVTRVEQKVERAKADLAAAEDALDQTVADAEVAADEAAVAEEAASGLDSFAFAGTAGLGMEH